MLLSSEKNAFYAARGAMAQSRNSQEKVPAKIRKSPSLKDIVALGRSGKKSSSSVDLKKKLQKGNL